MTTANEVAGLSSQRSYPLEPTAFDSGGGGGVHAVLGDPLLVAKIFTRSGHVDDQLGRRLRAVLEQEIHDPRLVRVVELLVAPDDPTELVGVLMGRVVGHTLYSVTNADERTLLGITLSTLDRLGLAAEVARAFETMHRRQMRLADAHHRNVLVTFDARGRPAGVVLIEPDTWIFEWRTAGAMEHFTSMARADYLPPEFQNVDLCRTPLTYQSDCFALTLLVCLALFDCTPQAFGGSTLSAEERIRGGFDWLTGTLPPGATPPDRLPIDPDAVPDEVMDLLRKGLSKNPKERPTAAALAAGLSAWHREVKDRVDAGRFWTALSKLVRARTLGDIRRRAVDTFFAALRRLAPQTAALPGAWWVAVTAKVLLLVLALAGVVLWSGGASVPLAPTETEPAGSVPPGPTRPTKDAVTPPASTSDWRTLIDR